MRRWGEWLLLSLMLAGCARSAPGPLDYSANLAPLQTAPPVRMSHGDLAKITEPQAQLWIGCVLDAASRYMEASEGAEVVARASMTACHEKETTTRDAIALLNRTDTTTTAQMNFRRTIIFDSTVQMVISQRVNLKRSRELSNAWAECLIDQALENTKADRPEPEIVRRTFQDCHSTEEAMSRHLASFNDYAGVIVENRKKRVLPILAGFIGKIRNAVGEKPKRPDLTI